MPEPPSRAARDIFLEVVTLTPPERVAVLDERCGTDPELRAAVEQLLAGDTEDSFLAASPVAIDPDATIPHVPASDDATIASGAGAGPGGRVTPGTMVGPYRVEAVLGVGGMGEVYRAVDTRLDRRVALKSIRADRRLGDEARQRFEREARILSSLDHPNICRLYDYFTTLPRDYLVLELIEGEPLDAVRRELSTADLLRIAEQIARVLAVAHAAGIVHRDLKPENVMVTKAGDAKVLDFGIARPAKDVAEPGPDEPEPFDATASAQLFRTSVSGIIGTPMYMSPEQARGADATVASDMYAFGLVLQELFTGATPYAEPHDLASLLDKARAGELRPIAGVRGDIATLIRRLTKSAPSARLTAVEAVAAIKRIRERPRRWLRRALATAAIVIAVAGVAKYTVDLDQERQIAIKERGDAETLTTSMLTDFVGIAREIGRLDAVETVGARVREYFENRPEGTVDDEDLYRYGQAIGVIGQARLNDQEAWTTADESFVEQIGIIRPLVERNPERGAWRKALGEAYFYRGQYAYWSGDADAARRHFASYLDESRALAANDPDDPEWTLEVAYALTSLAAIESKAEAIALHDESIAIKRALWERLADASDEHPLWADVAESLANGLTYRADLVADYDERRRLYEESLAIRRNAHDRRPDDAARRHRLAIGCGKLGEFLVANGDDEAALDVLRRQTELMYHLCKNVDGANANWRRDLAAAYRGQAESLRNLGRDALALKFYGDARAEWDIAFNYDGDNRDWNEEYRRMARGYAPLLAAHGAWGDLLSYVPQVRDCLERLGLPSDPATPAASNADALDLAKLDLVEGQARAALGEPDRARGLWERMIVWLAPFVEARPLSEVGLPWLDAYAQAGLRLGRPEAAAPYAHEVVARDEAGRHTTLRSLMREAGLPVADDDRG